MDIPTLDASTFSSGSDAQRAKFAADLVDIFSRQRFVKLVNHGVNDDIIRELFDWVGSVLNLQRVDWLTLPAEQAFLRYPQSKPIEDRQCTWPSPSKRMELR